MHAIKITISCHIAQAEDIAIRLYNVKHVVCLIRRFAGANDRPHLYRRIGIHWFSFLEDISIATATQATALHYSSRQVDHTSMIVGTCTSACTRMFIRVCACMRMCLCARTRVCAYTYSCVPERVQCYTGYTTHYTRIIFWILCAVQWY